eukprot:2084795-Rhodomonas_salina.1
MEELDVRKEVVSGLSEQLARVNRNDKEPTAEEERMEKGQSRAREQRHRAEMGEEEETRSKVGKKEAEAGDAEGSESEQRAADSDPNANSALADIRKGRTDAASGLDASAPAEEGDSARVVLASAGRVAGSGGGLGGESDAGERSRELEEQKQGRQQEWRDLKTREWEQAQGQGSDADNRFKELQGWLASRPGKAAPVVDRGEGEMVSEGGALLVGGAATASGAEALAANKANKARSRDTDRVQ